MPGKPFPMGPLQTRQRNGLSTQQRMRISSLSFLLLLLWTLSTLPGPVAAGALESAVSGQVLTAAWSQQPPYQFLETQRAQQYPDGLD
ncbi:MAG: hypothetical protein ACP5DC_09365, partial [Halothiobacillaceae bacterium]